MTLTDPVPCLDQQFGIVTVPCGYTLTVIDDHTVAETVHPAALNHLAGGGSFHTCPHRDCYINSAVKLTVLVDGMDPPAIWRGDSALYRPNHPGYTGLPAWDDQFLPSPEPVWI